MWLCLGCYSLKSFGVFLNHRPRMPSRHAFLCAACRRQIRDLFVSADRQPTLSTLAHSSRRADGSPQARELAARPLLRGTVRLLDRRGLSPPSPTNLDRPARRWFETDSAFYGMNQLNGPLLHVS